MRWRAVGIDALDYRRVAHGVPGCYAIYVDDRLVYIGSGVNVRARLNEHMRANGKLGPLLRSASIRFKAVGSRRYGDWLTREVRLIGRLRPPWNVHTTSNHLRRLGDVIA